MQFADQIFPNTASMKKENNELFLGGQKVEDH